MAVFVPLRAVRLNPPSIVHKWLLYSMRSSLTKCTAHAVHGNQLWITPREGGARPIERIIVDIVTHMLVFDSPFHRAQRNGLRSHADFVHMRYKVPTILLEIGAHEPEGE